MLSQRNRNFAWWIFAVGCGGLAVLFWLFPVKNLIILLNAVYAGSMVGIIFAYWHLIVATVKGVYPVDRASQYALGVFMLWAAYTATVIISIYTRATGIETPTYMVIVASRYMAILAAWLQVTAPDFGEGFFSTRDRRVLWVAVGISVAASTLLLIVQSKQILS